MSLMRNIQYDSVYGNYFITIKAVGSVDMFVCASNVCVCVSQYKYIYIYTYIYIYIYTFSTRKCYVCKLDFVLNFSKLLSPY